MDYKNLCSQVQDIARAAGSFIRDEQKKISESNIEIKSVASLVTYVDKTAEQQIVSALKALIPDSGFVAEEGTAASNNENGRNHRQSVGISPGSKFQRPDRCSTRHQYRHPVDGPNMADRIDVNRSG